MVRETYRWSKRETGNQNEEKIKHEKNNNREGREKNVYSWGEPV